MWIYQWNSTFEVEQLRGKTQFMVCKDGDQLRSFHKYPTTNPKTGKKDYVIMNTCMALEQQACVSILVVYA